MFLRFKQTLYCRVTPSSTTEPLLSDQGYHAIETDMLAKTNDPTDPLIESEVVTGASSTAIKDIKDVFETPEGHDDGDSILSGADKKTDRLTLCYEYVSTLFQSIKASLKQVGEDQQDTIGNPQNTDISAQNTSQGDYSKGYLTGKR